MKAYQPVLSASFLSLFASVALGFGEDVCFTNDSKNNEIVNCINVEADCRKSSLEGNALELCKAKALLDGITGLSPNSPVIGGRSLLHADATYIMAQMIGFTPWQAYQILMYNEAADQIQYRPFDANGTQIIPSDDLEQCIQDWTEGNIDWTTANKCAIVTKPLSGISRFNSDSGGMLLHLHARYRSPFNVPVTIKYPVDYMHADYKRNEVLLNHMSNWVFNKHQQFCTGGITTNPDDYDSSPHCDQGILESPMSLFAIGPKPIKYQFKTKLGPGPMRLHEGEQYGEDVLATDCDLDEYIYPHDFKLAKFGIFLHTLADRYSHHVCTDNSFFFKNPSTEKDGYSSKYDVESCAQGNHFLWHAWEQGAAQKNISTEHQNMEPALKAVYTQLVKFANQYHEALGINQSDIPTNIPIGEIKMLVEILSEEKAEQRLMKVQAYMLKNSLLPLPGYNKGQTDITKWLHQAKYHTVTTNCHGNPHK